MKIGPNIRRIRLQKGVKAQELAGVLGIKLPQYSKLENTDSGLTPDRISTIAEYLNVDKDLLYKFDENYPFQNFVDSMNDQSAINNHFQNFEAERELFERHIKYLENQISLKDQQIKDLLQTIQKISATK